MGKSNASQTKRREQKRECEKIFQKEKEKNKRYKHGRENGAIEQHGIQPTPERERKEKMIKNERKYSKTNHVAVGNLGKQKAKWSRETNLGQSALRTHVSCWR